jgi:predicted AAA+ superfamily ATPase
VQNLVDRDVRQLAEIARAPQLTTLIRLLAARSGQIVAPGSLESELQLSRPTIARYLALLDEVFLIKRVPGWSRSLGSRVTNAPKPVFVDSGIATQLLGLDAHALRRPGAPFGPLLEGLVVSELARQMTWSRDLADLYHYRDHHKVEVDAILENRRRQVVAIEIKAASTVRAEDFAGLRRLSDRLGDDLLVGLVLYTGPTTFAVRTEVAGNPDQCAVASRGDDRVNSATQRPERASTSTTDKRSVAKRSISVRVSGQGGPGSAGRRRCGRRWREGGRRGDHGGRH